MTWEEFRVAFYDRFFPESIRKTRATQFESLRQISHMPVVEYDIQFTQLSRYAPYLVPDEITRSRRFVDGLERSLFELISSPRSQFPSYAAVVNCVG